MAARVVAPLVVIIGPTASGKTTLAIELAEKYGGEIICADSRTIYKGMDIGTAKPTHEEQSRVPHWGLDLVEPGEAFSVADFKQYTVEKIREIRARNHLPFLVGGSGLYVDAILFDFQFGGPADSDRRKDLERRSLSELYEYCEKNNIELSNNRQNKRYVIRAIERDGAQEQSRDTPIDNCIVVGITTDKSVLRIRISDRTEQLFDDGVVKEAKTLGEKYGWNSEAMTGNIYPLVYEYYRDEISLDALKQKLNGVDWHLAKRQMMWFRRNPYIEWCAVAEVGDYVDGELASVQ